MHSRGGQINRLYFAKNEIKSKVGDGVGSGREEDGFR